MKPFDLERAIAGDPVVTRDGREVTQFAQFHIPGEIQCRAVVGGNRIAAYEADGSLCGNGSESPLDLFMAPKKTKVWCNFYKGSLSGLIICGGAYSSEDSALSHKNWLQGPEYLQTIMVEVEE